jgi:integrase
MKGYLRVRDRRSSEKKRAHRLKADQQKWLLVVDAGYHVKGKRLQKFRSFTGTREEADDKLRQFVAEVKTGIVVGDRLSTAEYLARWLEQKRTEGLAGKTVARYEGIVRDYLIPELGSGPIAKVAAAHVKQALLVWRSAICKNRKRRKLADRTVHHIFATLKSALNEALREEAVKRNACLSVRPPSKGRSHVEAIDETAALVLLEKLDATALGLPTLIAVYTGLRRGELLSLRWSDIDLDARTLFVRRSLELTKNEAGALVPRFKEPKTAKSHRAVALPTQAVAALRAHRASQGQVRLSEGIAASEHDLVFPEPEPIGWRPTRPWNPDRFSAQFYWRVKTSGLPKVTFHGLRHSFASIALRAGVPLKVVSEQLGHTSVKTTGDLYTEVLGDLQRDAADRMDDVFDRARANRNSG